MSLFAGSKRGVKYIAANGAKIPNLEQLVLPFQNADGTQGKILFQVAQITKPLVSVSKLIEEGHIVVFDEVPDELGNGGHGSYIEHKASGKRMALKLERGVFIIDAFTVPENKKPDFSRRGLKQ